MAIYKQDIVNIDLDSGNVFRSFAKITIGTADKAANRFGIRAFRGNVEADLSGASCYGYFRDPQGNNIALTSYGTVSGNVAYVTLPQACYNYEGQFCLAIKLLVSGVTSTVRIIDGVVDNTNTGSAVAPTSAVPSYSEILSTYDQMVAAVAVANSAIATTFNAATVYPAGSYVINDGALYRITADHAANVTWANTSKVATNIGAEVTDLKSAITSEGNANGKFDLFTGMTSGKVYSRTGSKSNNNSYSISKLFKISGKSLLLVGYAFKTNNVSTIAFYSNNNAGSGSFVDYWIPDATGSGKYKVIPVPTGAQFFGISMPNDHLNETEIYNFNVIPKDPVKLFDVACSKTDGVEFVSVSQSLSFINREDNGSYTFYTDNESAQNACYARTKRALFFYDVQVTGKLVMAGGTKSMHLIALEQDTGASEPVASANPKLAVYLSGTNIRIIYRKNTTTETVATIDYTTGDVVTARIQRKGTFYNVTIIYDGKTYSYTITENDFGGTYHFGYAADYICFGLCTTATGNYGTINVNLDYLHETGLEKIGVNAPIAKAAQYKAADTNERFNCQFAYKTLARATFPPTADVNGYHTNPGVGYPNSGTWTWDSFFNAICAIHIGGEAVQIMKQDYIVHQNKKYSNGFFPRQVLENGQTDATTQPWNAQTALMLSEASADYDWFDYDLLKADVFAWDTVRKTSDGLYWVHNGYETGLDNSSAIYYPETSEQASTMVDNCVSVMFSSLIAAEYMALSQIAKIKEPSAVSIYANKYTEIKTAINNHMWNSTDGFYYTINKTTGVEIPVKHGENIAFAMWAKIPSAEQVATIAATVESAFLADYGCYSVAKTDSTFHDNDTSIFRVNWNGPAWIPMMYCMSVGLHNYGYDTLAQKIIDGANLATTHFAKEEGSLGHTMPEFYNPDTLAAYGYMDYSWGICTAFYNEQLRNNSFLQSVLFRN